ncbi:hypothetical protein [Sphingomonas sp.]|uniref:MuF-C-terminal domain-containing protein n=1 Tax=Sphingomonas sp. TaxID=28214 RepID=UPI002ED8EA5C
MRDNDLLSGWALIVDRIVRGESLHRPIVTVGPTPELLSRYGLSSGGLMMKAAKVATCRRIHPEVPLDVWHNLPSLLANPLAIFPSARRDGSVVTLLIVKDRDNNPIVVAISPDANIGHNVVLSVYGKDAGFGWAATEMEAARKEGLPVYEGNGFAASLPQPPAVETASSSHGLIPSDGTAKPKRDILSIKKNSS